MTKPNDWDKFAKGVREGAVGAGVSFRDWLMVTCRTAVVREAYAHDGVTRATHDEGWFLRFTGAPMALGIPLREEVARAHLMVHKPGVHQVAALKGASATCAAELERFVALDECPRQLKAAWQRAVDRELARASVRAQKIGAVVED